MDGRTHSVFLTAVTKIYLLPKGPPLAKSLQPLHGHWFEGKHTQGLTLPILVLLVKMISTKAIYKYAAMCV